MSPAGTSKNEARRAGSPADAAAIATELEGLTQLSLNELRVQFRNRTGRIAPTRISQSLLLRVLAYRIQADRFGDLAADIRRMLERLAAADRSGQPRRCAAPAPSDARTRPMSGTVLIREWRGQMQHVSVLESGFAWNGAIYASLSAVAFAITGTKWNGRRFFGLRGTDLKPSSELRRAAAGSSANALPQAVDRL